MEPFWRVMVPGIIGGSVIALVLFWLNHRSSSSTVARPSSPDQPPTDVINIARIRVAGVGGLGLVAMAIVVALALPRLGQSLGLGLVLGAVLAGVLIARRNRTGSMPSSGRRFGANTTLSIDTPGAVPDDPSRDDVRPPQTSRSVVHP